MLVRPSLPRAWPRLVLPLFFAGLVAHTAWDKSPTWDEPGYLGLGPYLIDHGRWDVPGTGSHPPLAYYLQGRPFLNPVYALVEARWAYPVDTVRDLSFVRSADVDRGNAIMMDPRYDGEILLWWCRMSCLVIAAGLFYCLWRWARDLYGTMGATVALGAACCLPGCSGGWHWRANSPHCCGCRRPPCSGLHHPHREARNRLATWAGPVSRSRLRPWVGSAVALAALLMIAAVVLWVLYGFRVMPFWTVLTSQLWDLSCGHEAYLFGRYSTEGWWYLLPHRLPGQNAGADAAARLLGRYDLGPRRRETLGPRPAAAAACRVLQRLHPVRG